MSLELQFQVGAKGYASVKKKAGFLIWILLFN